MIEILKKSILASIGVLDLSAEKVRKAVDKLVEKRRINKEEAKKLVDELVERGKKEKEKLEKALERGLTKGLKLTNIASRQQVEKLEKRLAKLEEELKKGKQ